MVGGGHSEITPGLDRPILVGQMLGEVAPARLVRERLPDWDCTSSDDRDFGRTCRFGSRKEPVERVSIDDLLFGQHCCQ